MPRDAFGREIGEDSLADLGWKSSSPAGQVEAVAQSNEMAKVGEALGVGESVDSGEAVGRKSMPGIPGPPSFPIARVVRLLVTLALAGAILIGALSALNASDDVRDLGIGKLIDSVRSITDEAGDTARPAPADEQIPSKPPAGLQRGSLLLRSNFSRAMRRLRDSGKGKLRSLRVAPDRIDAQLLTRDGRLRSVQYTYKRELREFSTSGPGFGFVGTMPFASVNSAAPYRMASSAAGRLRKPATGVDYLVLIDFAGTPTWSLFFKNGKHFQGDARGRITRQLS